MRLKEYLEKSGTSQEAFAQIIGTSQPTVSKLASGRGLPSIEMAYRIQVASAGAVVLEDWFTPPIASEAEKSAP